MNKFITVLLVAVFGVFFGAFVIYAQTTGNGSLSLVKDPSSGLFTLTVSDVEGVASFALEFKTGKLPYSGDLSGCGKSKTISNIAAFGDSDLAEKIKGKVTDCRGGETEFEISAVDARGRAQIKKLGEESKPAPSPSTPSPTPQTQTKTTPSEPTPVSTPTASEIVYPVPELGNCKDKTECHVYCEKSENVKQCLAFAKKHQLLPEDEIRLAEKVLGVKGGPGGCSSRVSCENYCNDVANIEVCIAFAEENGLMKGKELEEAKKVRAAVQGGQKLPGGCRNKNACENYCKNPEHIDECLAFAESSGFLSPQELEQAKKFMPLIKSGQTPGGCKSKDECESYCESDEHADECIDFAIKHGMIPEEQRKHIEAFKKAGGKGPGGCKGRQCQAFCENPANRQVCFEWAKDSGILKEEDIRRMEEGKHQLKQALEQMPPGAKECVEAIVGPGGLEGDFFGGPEIGDKIKSCFEQAFGGFGPPGGPGGPAGGGPGFGAPPGGIEGEEGKFGGPGGCKSIDECMAFCNNNPDQCQGFGPPGGHEGGPPPGVGEFPPKTGEFPPPGEFPGKGEFPPPGDQFPHERFPTPEQFPGQGAEQFQQQYQQQYQQEAQKQIQQQIQQQLQQGGSVPPSDLQQLQQLQQSLQPSGEYHPPEGSYTQPPPPPPPTSPPTSSVKGPFGLIIAPFVELFR